MLDLTYGFFKQSHIAFNCPSSSSWWRWFYLPEKVSSYVYWERWSPHPQWGCSIIDNGSGEGGSLGPAQRTSQPLQHCLSLPQLSCNPVSDWKTWTFLCLRFCLPPCFDPEQRTKHSELGFTASIYWIQSITIHHPAPGVVTGTGTRWHKIHGWGPACVCGTAKNSNTPYTDWSTRLMYQYNQQVYNYINISFSKYTVLLI